MLTSRVLHADTTQRTHQLQVWDDHPVPQQCFESSAPQNWAWPFLIV